MTSPLETTREKNRKLESKQHRIRYFDTMRSRLFTKKGTGEEAFQELLTSLGRIREPKVKSECVIALHIMLNSFHSELLGLEELGAKDLALLTTDWTTKTRARAKGMYHD